MTVEKPVLVSTLQYRLVWLALKTEAKSTIEDLDQLNRHFKMDKLKKRPEIQSWFANFQTFTEQRAL